MISEVNESFISNSSDERVDEELAGLKTGVLDVEPDERIPTVSFIEPMDKDEYGMFLLADNKEKRVSVT